MTCRLVIITEIISPYRIPLFNALAQRGVVDLHVIFLAENDPSLRQWQIHKEEIRFSYQVLPSWRKRIGKYNVLLNRRVGRALVGSAPDVIVCGGYNYVTSWYVLLWARIHKIPFLLWSESNLQDMRRGHALVEFLKNQFIFNCSGFVVPGKSAHEYLRAHNIDERIIFTAPNAVDNDLFAAAAAAIRQNASLRRRELDLPSRYFLFAGRLVREKGVFDLLAAYAKLNETLRQQVGLVLVGDGASRRQLEEQASRISPGVIRFAGFVHREQLPTYYALAEMLILPTYTDPWGLVVNEAMACGLPVIVSDVAGCAVDLVTEDWNGKIVPARDVATLAAAVRMMAEDPERRALMALNSSRRILSYSPKLWSAGILEMVQKVGTRRG
jgi:glycosyltransferase involved in cell wall biosynthesis